MNSERMNNMSKSKYYDGTKLLSLKDIDGNRPELYICTSNRSAGKTTYFARLLVNKYRKYGIKFMLIYRFNYELDSVSEKFFKDIQKLFFPDLLMKHEKRARGMFAELYIAPKPETDEPYDEKNLPWESCGYAISLNSADNIKKYSHFFSDVGYMMFDEFQSETNKYCPDETTKFISVHTSVARGNGEQTRYVPVFMVSNPVTILNPYYVDMGISNRLDDKVKFLKGTGFVLEQGYNESASQAQEMSAFNRAFSNHKYVAYSSQSIYLNDNKAFIEKPYGNSRYIATLKYMGTEYGIREFPDMGIIYCDDRPDKDYYNKISVTTEDHDINYVMLKTNEIFLNGLRYYFDRGCFRFKNLKCKEVILTALSY